MNKIIAVAVLAFMLGCGDEDDSNNVSANNASTNNASTNNTSTNNASTNNASTNNASTNNASTNNTSTNNTSTNNVVEEPEFTQTVNGFTLVMEPHAEVLKVGANTFAFALSDANGPVDATDFEVDGWMPGHGHGTAVPTTVEKTGTGEYEAVVTFNMGGDWDINVTADSAEFTFAVKVVR